MAKTIEVTNYIYSCILGVIVFDNNFEIIERIPITLDDLKELMNKSILDKERSLLKKYKNSMILGCKELTTPDNDNILKAKISEDKNLLQKAQSTIDELSLNKKESAKSKELILNIFENNASLNSPDFNLISSSVKSIEELDDSINKISKRAQEALFEFIPQKISSQKDPALFVSELECTSFEEITTWIQKEPLAKPFDDASYKIIISYSKSLSYLFKLKEEMLNFLRSKLLIISPNLYNLLGEIIASKLISKAGSLKRLAKMPASTIQLLGAENAFFRFLKSGGRNPKHGYIYNHSFVLRAKRKNQGKAARILANKISICAKVDFFSEYLDIDTLQSNNGFVNKCSDRNSDNSNSIISNEHNKNSNLPKNLNNESLDKYSNKQNIAEQKTNSQNQFSSKKQIPKTKPCKTNSEIDITNNNIKDNKISEKIKKELLKLAEKL